MRRHCIQSDHGNLLSRATAQPHQRAVHRYPSAQHGCRILVRNILRDLEGKVLMRSYMARITALRDGAVLIRAAVRIHRTGTVILLTDLAIRARQVGVDLGANPYAIPDLDGPDVVADADRAPDHLVSDAQRHGLLAPAARDGVHVGTAHAAGVDGDVHVVAFKGLEFELRGIAV
jgi:hypothetical protein